VEKRYEDFKALLKDPNVDAVHINSPIPDHGWMSIEALKAGKHVACTVPMATSIADCKKIVELVKKTGLSYMMMETVVYAREYLFMKQQLMRANSASSSSCRPPISRTWTAGRTTGPAFHPCGMPPTASARWPA
jgi:predicted dehydrogenase